ncbi:MAG TPA: NAD(P)H-binding protein [Capillimicrobium sp.]|jgi:uncharacterized protein YbjT (DUF2867 family)
MDVVVAGGHGQIALRLLRLLADRGDRARGLIRNPDHAADLTSVGATPVLCDLEGDGVDVAAAVAGADAVVFAAGAGPGSGAARKRTMDHLGAVRLIEAAQATGVDRYLMISAMGAGRPELARDDVFAAYLVAKGAADEALRASGLAFTIVRPGLLSDDPGTGLVAAAPELPRGQIPRDDVAATLLAVLDAPLTAGLTFDLVSGDTPVAEAVAALPAA